MAISKHVLFCVLLLVGILLASCEPDTRRPSRPTPPRRPPPPPPRRPPPPPPRRPPPPPPSSPPPPSPPPPSPPPPPSGPLPGYDYFMLTLQWPNAICNMVVGLCNPPVPRQYFTIHGLWPQRDKGSSPQKCATNERMTDPILEKFRGELLEYWPRIFTADNFYKSKKLWIEQWDKHGSCSSNKFPPAAYLRTAIDLGKKYGPLILSKLKEKGIEPDETKLLTREQILDAIKDVTEKVARISCTEDAKDKVQLDDIRICFEADGKTLRDCKSTSGKDPCTKGFIFPPPLTDTSPPLTPRHTHFPSFISSILEVEEAVER